jgi:hypothetical protein
MLLMQAPLVAVEQSNILACASTRCGVSASGSKTSSAEAFASTWASSKHFAQLKPIS